MVRSLRFWIGLGASILFIVLFFFRVDIGEMWRALKGANYWFLLLGAPWYFLALWFRTLRWRLLLSPLGRFRSGRLWPALTIGYAANNLLPIRLGELVRAYYFGEKEKASSVAALATILVERVLDGLTLLILVGLSALFLPVVAIFRGLGEEVQVPWLALTLGFSLPFFLALFLFLVLVLVGRRAGEVLRRIGQFLPRQVREVLLALVFRFLGGLGVLHNPRRLLGVLLVSLPVWIVEGVVFFGIAFAFGIDRLFSSWALLAAVSILVMAVANLGTSLPSAGAGVGLFEFFGQTTLILLGVSAPVASAYIVVVHLSLVVPVTLLGLVYLWLDNLSLVRLARAGQAGAQAVAGGETDPP